MPHCNNVLYSSLNCCWNVWENLIANYLEIFIVASRKQTTKLLAEIKRCFSIFVVVVFFYSKVPHNQPQLSSHLWHWHILALQIIVVTCGLQTEFNVRSNAQSASLSSKYIRNTEANKNIHPSMSFFFRRNFF